MKNITNGIFICHKQVNNNTKSNSYNLKRQSNYFCNRTHDDIEAGLLGPKAILKHYIEILKKEGVNIINDDGKIPLYPIDKVEYTDEPPQIHFNAKGITCFGICPSYSDDDLTEEDYKIANEVFKKHDGV